MGYGSWSDREYRADAAFRAREGVADFGYTEEMFRRKSSTWRAHPSLDPFKVRYRESRDSVEHPCSTPIAVLFDVTGSMGSVPRIMQQRLADLHDLLRTSGSVRDPQILFGGIGDAETDRVPLQIGQFESDNRMDNQLRSIFLEGGGGGQRTESYELAAYFMAKHTVTDAWEKRGKKGYLFIIGDEMNKSELAAQVIRDVLGHPSRAKGRRGIADIASIYRELEQRWNVYFILPRQTSYYDALDVNLHWRRLLGSRFLRLEQPAAVCELIDEVIAMEEGRRTASEQRDDSPFMAAARRAIVEANERGRRELSAPRRFALPAGNAAAGYDR